VVIFSYFFSYTFKWESEETNMRTTHVRDAALGTSRDSSDGYKRIINLSDGRKFFTSRINVVLPTVPPISRYKIQTINYFAIFN
jgi:hypothetical protein